MPRFGGKFEKRLSASSKSGIFSFLALRESVFGSRIPKTDVINGDRYVDYSAAVAVKEPVIGVLVGVSLRE